MTLRSKLIHLAHQKPELRAYLLPVLTDRVAATVDMKKVVAKLVKDTEKDLKAFREFIPEEVRSKFWPTIVSELQSPPPRGGYGPYEKGTIWFSSYRIEVVGDVSDSTVGFATYSGPHHLRGDGGPIRGALIRLAKLVAPLKEFVTKDLQKYLAANPTGTPLSGINLKGINLGPAGKARSVGFNASDNSWSIEPTNRQRLDHYIGAGYFPGEGDDPEGWDEEGWNEEYAGPTVRAAEGWLAKEFGPGLFYVDVGEKGHVDVQLTTEGKKKFSISQ